MLISEHFSFLDAVLIDNLFKSDKKPYIERNYYIPAGHSFFATLSSNIFYFINNNDVQLDYFLKSFGLAYQKIKRDKLWYKGMYSKAKEERVTQLVKQIIIGESVFDNEQDWIISKRGKINLVDASSGQQESLPITTILLRTPYCYNSYINNHFVIEEPEAHSFPKAHNDIVCLIANAYTAGVVTRKDKIVNTFTITTHSPYILTAFNNLIQAGNVVKSKNHKNYDELYKIVPKDELIDFDDVSAYFVEKGTVKSILDHELKLIDAHAIDSISRQFAQTFEKLVMMEENND